jgi:hypothetical protein
MPEPTTTLTLSALELEALLIGLREYLYLVEEGNLAEALDEMDWSSTAETLTPVETSRLIDRIHDAMDTLSEEPK